MEATKEQNCQLGNKVPNSFEELNEMTGGQYEMPKNEVNQEETMQQRNQEIPEQCQSMPIQMTKKEEKKYQIPESEYIWNPPYLKKTQIFPSYVIAADYPTQQMLKEFTTKLRERSCGFDEYSKQINVEDFVKYDKDNLWKTSNDVMNQYVPPIEGNTDDTSTGLKTTISPIQAKRMKESERKEYYDPLKKYAQIAEDEGKHIERNPLNNHKLIQNSYFPMSRLIGSYWDKVDKESYFRNRYDKLNFDPSQRDSGYSTNLKGNIDFKEFYPKDSESALPHPKEDYKQTEYRNTFWRNKGFPFKQGPQPIAHTAATMQIQHYN